MNCWMNEAPGQPLTGPDSSPMQNGVRPSAAAASAQAVSSSSVPPVGPSYWVGLYQTSPATAVVPGIP